MSKKSPTTFPKRLPNISGGTIDQYLGGIHITVDFPNGYGASVVCNEMSYGGHKGFFELAVLHGETLCYNTPITHDVIGWLKVEEVEELVKKIEALPSNDNCDHQEYFLVPLKENEGEVN